MGIWGFPTSVPSSHVELGDKVVESAPLQIFQHETNYQNPGQLLGAVSMGAVGKEACTKKVSAVSFRVHVFKSRILLTF